MSKVPTQSFEMLSDRPESVFGEQSELAGRIDRLTSENGETSTAIPFLRLHRFSRSYKPTHVLIEPSLCIVAQGTKRVMLGDGVYHYDASHYLLVSVDLPCVSAVVEASPDVPYLGLRIMLDPAGIGALLMETRLPETSSRASERGLAVSEIGGSLLNAVLRLVRLLETPEDIPALAPLVMREINYRLLCGEQSGQLRQIAAGNNQVQRIATAINWLKRHYDQPLHIEELAREAGMSPSSLHHHFKSVTALSPLQYQKQLRLQEARKLMLADALDAATAGFRVGYESATQFNREYSRLFGAPPLRDITRLRDASLVESAAV